MLTVFLRLAVIDHPPEVATERLDLAGAEAGEMRIHHACCHRHQARQERATVRGEAQKHDAAVLAAALPPHQAFLLETVEDARHGAGVITVEAAQIGGGAGGTLTEMLEHDKLRAVQPEALELCIEARQQRGTCAPHELAYAESFFRGLRRDTRLGSHDCPATHGHALLC